MAESGGDAEDRTEAPSPHRLEKAREDGDVPLSREAVQLAALGAGTLAASVLGPGAATGLAGVAQAVLGRAHELTPAEALGDLLRAGAPLALGVAAAAGLGAVAATLVQSGLLVSAKALIPKFSKLNPLSGAKRLFGMASLEEFGRTLLKLAAVGGALWWSCGDPAPLLAALAEGPAELGATLSALLLRVLASGLGGLAVVAALDIAWVRLRRMKRLRMSREELKQEHKESEGDPHIKAKRRQIMRGRSRRRTLAAVPGATVVVTNPTHFAVALAYERGKDAAPRVVAKGADLLAARIRAEAEKHGVPILSNPPLARALFLVEEDTAIPAEHFQAVAEIIAFVWRLKGRAAR
ncbi:EscU/YscU/HrcU family type III secretion system export apparatus switch protein [Roseicella aquatilis]|uniref:Flagellar biosynthesis protein FlhB n=1 Tax=Roseicella aquatilis TaxID=2527868 RepID=A0A4R4D4S5_9PROT|nr:flagellar type III secretion system protein FlhB [Roseicella aquatilis]TCZ53678.1 flagellar biosynthesis protein FlhB [Roseicella aquatilis]